MLQKVILNFGRKLKNIYKNMKLKNKIDPETLGQLVLTAIGFVFLVWLIIICASCKTQKQTYQYTGTDYTTAKDSTAQAGHQEQTAATSSADSSAIAGTIVFTEGGGTVTAGGVELQGVAQIDGSVFASAQVFHVEHYIHDTTTIAVHDTLTLEKVVEVKTEKKSSAVVWPWLVFCYICGVGTVIALKKIPYTRPFMAWL